MWSRGVDTQEFGEEHLEVLSRKEESIFIAMKSAIEDWRRNADVQVECDTYPKTLEDDSDRIVDPGASIIELKNAAGGVSFEESATDHDNPAEDQVEEYMRNKDTTPLQEGAGHQSDAQIQSLSPEAPPLQQEAGYQSDVRIQNLNLAPDSQD